MLDVMSMAVIETLTHFSTTEKLHLWVEFKIDKEYGNVKVLFSYTAAADSIFTKKKSPYRGGATVNCVNYNFGTPRLVRVKKRFFIFGYTWQITPSCASLLSFDGNNFAYQ